MEEIRSYLGSSQAQGNVAIRTRGIRNKQIGSRDRPRRAYVMDVAESIGGRIFSAAKRVVILLRGHHGAPIG